MDDIWSDILSSWSGEKVSYFDRFYQVIPNHESPSYDEEETRCILYSFASSSRSYMTKCELSMVFPDSTDLLDFLLESTDHRITPSLACELTDQVQSSTNVSLIRISGEDCIEIIPQTFRANSSVLVVIPEDYDSNLEVLRIDVADRSGVSAIIGLPFGINRWKLTCASLGAAKTGKRLLYFSGVVNCCSPTYDFISALEDAIDQLHWGWGYGGSWTTDLENSLLELLVAVSDDLRDTVRNWEPMMAIVGGAAQEMNKMLDTVNADVALALNNHSAYAIGRLHQSLVQLVDLNRGNSGGVGSGGFSFGAMMGIPEAFCRAVEAFIRAKMAASPAMPLINSIRELVKTIPDYVNSVLIPKGNNTEAAKLQSFITTFNEITHEEDTNNRNHTDEAERFSVVPWEVIVLLHSLPPKAVDMFSSMGFGVAGANNSTGSSVEAHRFPAISYLPVLPMDVFESPSSVSSMSLSAGLPADGIANRSSASQRMNDIVQQYSESLAFGAVNIGSMLGYKLAGGASLSTDAVADAVAKLLQLLDTGFTYVASAGKLMAILPTKRSVLVVRDIPDESSIPGVENIITQSAIGETASSTSIPNLIPGTLPRGLAKRLKDMPRVFRNKIDPRLSNSTRGGDENRGRRTVSFRLNTDFDLALSLLRQHHGDDCWVGPELEAVWRQMFYAQPPTLLVFELWYHSGGQDCLVAADFAHPTAHGTSVYVATRFFNRESSEIKQLQPGFLLALVETKFLRDHGCVLWDLGGVDMCPLMQYKYDLTGDAMSRPMALSWFRRAKAWGSSRPLFPARESDTTENADCTVNKSDSPGIEVVSAGNSSSNNILSLRLERNLSSLRGGTVILNEIALTDLYCNNSND